MQKIFNLSIYEKQVKPVQATVNTKKTTPSIKIDAMKIIGNVLDELINVNNSKVDTLRKLYIDIDSGKLNHIELVSFLRQSESKRKKKKIKALISGL